MTFFAEPRGPLSEALTRLLDPTDVAAGSGTPLAAEVFESVPPPPRQNGRRWANLGLGGWAGDSLRKPPGRP